MEERYKKNNDMFTDKDMNILLNFKVCFVGCGGLGGYIAEMLSRIGVGNLTLIDGDVFDETNLNRQLLSSTENLGKNKAAEAKKRILSINPDTNATAVTQSIDNTNSLNLLGSHDIVIDAVDKIPAKKLIQDTCGDLNIPMVFGAIAAWYGQISLVMPGSKVLDRLFRKNSDSGIESKLGNPSFTPGLIASLQVSECIKYLTGKKSNIKNKILYVNLLDNSFNIYEV